MLSPEIRKLASRCVSLRRNKDAIGKQLDQIDAERAASKGTGQQLCEDRLKQYATLDAEYDRLFNQLCDAEDGIVAAPATSKCDVIAKTKIMAERASEFDTDVGPDIALLHQQVRQWKRVGPVEWP